METIELRQRRDFSAVISTGFQYVRQNWKSLYRPLAFFCLPLYVVASLFMGNFFRTVYANMEGANSGAMLGSMGSMGAGYLLMILAMLMMYTLVYEHMRHYMLNRGLPPSSGEMWKAMLQQLPAYFVVGLLAGIIAMAGVVLLFVGALWLAIVFTMAYPLRAFERAGIGECISRSFRVIKGHWWETFGLVLVLVMLITFISYFLYLPLMLLTGFSAMSGMEPMGGAGEYGQRMGWFMTLFMLLAGVVNMLLLPFLHVPIGLQALSLIEEKEGRGLMQRVDEATAPPAA
ncbi:MAG: hypothetical protein JST45_00370 [Bacteroidetes bacterium]|nr:hypothetical protein [Bacteroidota bacterium]